MSEPYNQDAVDAYQKLLDCSTRGDENVDESSMQSFFEEHTAFIPTPFMQNHQLHFNCFITKFPVGPYYTDLAYLTKSTVEWNVVLLEIENPKRKLFKGKIDHANFSAEFTHAMQQIRDWKAFIDDNHREVVDSLCRIRKPLQNNKVSFKYVLVMGRRGELENSQARRRAIADASSDEIKVITYDTILSDYERQRRIPEESIVLSMYQRDRFKVKFLPRHNHASVSEREKISTFMFTYMSPEDISLSSEQINVLKDAGYDMDSWSTGKYLKIDGKYTQESFSKKYPNNLLSKALSAKE